MWPNKTEQLRRRIESANMTVPCDICMSCLDYFLISEITIKKNGPMTSYHVLFEPEQLKYCKNIGLFKVLSSL